MTRRWFIFQAAVVALALLASSAWCQTKWKIHQTVRPEHPPVDLLVSPNRDWIYVLDDHGWISIYAASGQLKDKIQVGGDIQQIKAGLSDNVLFLVSRTTGEIRVISIDIVENIDVGDSPVKGSPDAPVSVVVFSDFQ